MSPMKKPKFKVAASSTKKPKMTFSRFIALLVARSPSWTSSSTTPTRSLSHHL